jgi:hypothetical protein
LCVGGSSLEPRATKQKQVSSPGAMTPVGRSDCGSDRRVRGPEGHSPESAQLIRSTSIRCDSVAATRSGTADRSTAAGGTAGVTAATLVAVTTPEQAAAAAEQTTTMLATVGLRAAGVGTRGGTGVRTGSRTGVRSARSRTAGFGAAGRLGRSATARSTTGGAPLVMAAEQTGVSAVHADDDCEGGDDCRPLHLEISLTFGLIA